MYTKVLTIASIITLLVSCHQSDPPVPQPSNEKGDLSFSGYEWWHKSGDDQMGPGPNYFSASAQNVWVDGDGALHLKITKDGGRWNCAEVISVQEMGYGTYIWTTSSDMTNFNEKAVLGLFSWDSYSFAAQANSEVDIEFSRWNDPNDSTLLTYSVQPVWFTSGPPYDERSKKPAQEVSKLKTTCTHAFVWTPSKISWTSYIGDTYPGSELISSWEFDLNNPARRKEEGGQSSDPVIIPAPGDSTNARMNLWLLGGQPPADGSETEVVIKSFQYKPL